MLASTHTPPSIRTVIRTARGRFWTKITPPAYARTVRRSGSAQSPAASLRAMTMMTTRTTKAMWRAASALSVTFQRPGGPHTI